MEAITCRRLTAETEIRAALALAERVFDRFVAPDYTAEGVATFHHHTAWENNREPAESGAYVYYGAFAGDTLLGVAASRENGNRVMLLFVEERYQRRGVARLLMETLLEHAPGPVVTVGASPYACQAYRRMGFRPTGVAETVKGMTFTPMAYQKEEKR